MVWQNPLEGRNSDTVFSEHARTCSGFGPGSVYLELEEPRIYTTTWSLLSLPCLPGPGCLQPTHHVEGLKVTQLKKCMWNCTGLPAEGSQLIFLPLSALQSANTVSNVSRCNKLDSYSHHTPFFSRFKLKWVSPNCLNPMTWDGTRI